MAMVMMMVVVFCHEWILRRERGSDAANGDGSCERAARARLDGNRMRRDSIGGRSAASSAGRASPVRSICVIASDRHVPGEVVAGRREKREGGRWREAPRTHRAEEPGVDDAGPREALEEHLDAEDEHDGVCHDGGSEPGAGIDEERRELFEARGERGGGRGAPRRHRPRAAPERTWTRPVRESAQRDARALRLVTRRAESRRPRARTERPRRCGGDAYRRHAVRLRRRGHRRCCRSQSCGTHSCAEMMGARPVIFP